MKIPEKFRINTKDFKIYFDNDKKTFVSENLDTGEKTNIGVLGILMQMGILKPIEDKTKEEKISLLEKINNLEIKIDSLTNNLDGKVSKPVVKEIPKEEPKSEINKRIMKKVLERTEEDEETIDNEEDSIDDEDTEDEEPLEDVEVESDEEIENWMKI